eukprot:gene27132-32776_t
MDPDIHFADRGSQKAFRQAPLPWHQFLRKKFHEALLGFVPVVGHIPPKLRVIMGFLYIFLLIAVFVILFVTGYYTDRSKVFLSPLNEKEASPYCRLIPQENTGKYMATYTGIWQRDAENYAASLATYSLSLFGSRWDYTEYATFMDNCYQDLVQKAITAPHRDAAANLLVWMGWSYSDPDYPANRMSLSGDPLVVFDRQSIVFTAGNSTHDCTAPTTNNRFSSSTGVLTSTYSMATFSATCRSALNPAFFGYDTITRPATFTMTTDVRTLTVALAVNSGATDLRNLVEVASFRRELTDALGVTYNISRFYDPKFPGMEPVGCILSLDTPACIVRRGQMAYIPVLHHVGANLSYPTLCNCTTYRNDLDDPSHPCHAFRFIVGFIHWNLPAGTGVMQLLRTKSIRQVMHESFKAAFITSTFGRTSPARGEFASRAARQEAFSFCAVPGLGVCSMFTFSSYDVDEGLSIVSSDYLQLPQLACNDTITPKTDSWSKLLTTPYASLNQQYQECRYSPREILQNQAGITFGNVEILTPGIIFFILLLVYVHRYLCCMPSHHFYNKAEKEGALDDFAIAMLMTRDGRMEHYGAQLEHAHSMHRNLVMPDGSLRANNQVVPFGQTSQRASERGSQRGTRFSHGIIREIVAELARNARNVQRYDNKEAVDFIQPFEADILAKDADGVEVIEGEGGSAGVQGGVETAAARAVPNASNAVGGVGWDVESPKKTVKFSDPSDAIQHAPTRSQYTSVPAEVTYDVTDKEGEVRVQTVPTLDAYFRQT